MTRDAPRSSIRIAIVSIGMIALGVVSRLTFAGNVPTTTVPFSGVVVLPLLVAGPAFAVMFVPLLFLGWSTGLLMGRQAVPIRSVVLLLCILIAVGYYFVTGWSYGIQYQGRAVTVSWAAFNVAIGATVTFFAVRLRRKPTWAGSAVFHWLLFAWPAWCGFPWLGEGI